MLFRGVQRKGRMGRWPCAYKEWIYKNCILLKCRKYMLRPILRPLTHTAYFWWNLPEGACKCTLSDPRERWSTAIIIVCQTHGLIPYFSSPFVGWPIPSSPGVSNSNCSVGHIRTYKVTRGPHYDADATIAVHELNFTFISCESIMNYRQIIYSRLYVRINQF